MWGKAAGKAVGAAWGDEQVAEYETQLKRYERDDKACTGQCARLAVLPGVVGLLYANEGAVFFQRLCR